jgi:hypothetical protein
MRLPNNENADVPKDAGGQTITNGSDQGSAGTVATNIAPEAGPVQTNAKAIPMLFGVNYFTTASLFYGRTLEIRLLCVGQTWKAKIAFKGVALGVASFMGSPPAFFVLN